MAKLPVKSWYEFNVDLDITEELLPFVKTFILTKNPETEEIGIISEDQTYRYLDIWYIYGDGDLLYAGQATDDAIITSPNYWRAKYIWQPNPPYGTSYLMWDAPPYDYPTWYRKLRWVYKSSTDKYHLIFPYFTDTDSFITLPYSTIHVKRNTGASLSTVQNMNPSYNPPEDYDFPHTQREIYEHISYPYQEKTWIKIGENKYRLKVEGQAIKLTDKVVTNTENYAIWNCTYTAKYWYDEDDERYRSYYILTSQSITTGLLEEHSGQETVTKLKLIVNYLNNKGNYEVREYTA